MKNSEQTSEQRVEIETVVAQTTQAEPVLLGKNIRQAWGNPSIHSLREHSGRTEEGRTAIAAGASILENPEAVQEKNADSGASCVGQGCCGKQAPLEQALPEQRLGSADAYWDMLLNPRPWWELSEGRD